MFNIALTSMGIADERRNQSGRGLFMAQIIVPGYASHVSQVIFLSAALAAMTSLPAIAQPLEVSTLAVSSADSIPLCQRPRPELHY